MDVNPSMMGPGMLHSLACCSRPLRRDRLSGAAADPRRRCASYSRSPNSFDPQFASEAASDSVISNIFEPMLDYDYLARPVKLVPRTLEAMPTVSDGGKTYLFKLRKGIYFTPDPAFKGKPRELTAADQVYGLKRLLDPAVKSPWVFLLDGKVLGQRRIAGKAAKAGKLDYDAPFPGSRRSTATPCASD